MRIVWISPMIVSTVLAKQTWCEYQQWNGSLPKDHTKSQMEFHWWEVNAGGWLEIEITRDESIISHGARNPKTITQLTASRVKDVYFSGSEYLVCFWDTHTFADFVQWSNCTGSECKLSLSSTRLSSPTLLSPMCHLICFLESSLRIRLGLGWMGMMSGF